MADYLICMGGNPLVSHVGLVTLTEVLTTSQPAEQVIAADQQPPVGLEQGYVGRRVTGGLVHGPAARARAGAR